MEISLQKLCGEQHHLKANRESSQFQPEYGLCFGPFPSAKTPRMPKVEITVAFAAVLRKRGAAKDPSQELPAEKANIHPTHLGLIGRSLRNPGLRACRAITDALEVPLAQMIAEAERLCPKKQ